MQAKAQNVAVIGAGIVGICSAIELRERGFEVSLIDRGAPGEACSFGNAGVLGAQSCVPFAMPGIIGQIPRMLFDRKGPLALRREGLTRTLPWTFRAVRGAYDGTLDRRADAMKALYGSTVELHERLAQRAGVPELIRQTSYLYAYRRAEDVDVSKTAAWRMRAERGAAIRVLDGEAIQEVEPELSRDYARAVQLGPIGHATHPFRLTQAYAALFQKLGGKLVRADVRGIESSGGDNAVGATKRVMTDQGPIAADIVVVTAGSWSLNLIEPLGMTFPLIAERGYHLTFADPGVQLNNVCNDASKHVAISSMEVGLRIAGTEELSTPDAPPDWRRAEVLASIVRDMFPRADLSRASRWMGPRPGTPDSLPAIGAVPGHPGVFVAAGHGHLGLTGAPMTGRLIAALASGERLNMDLAAYSLERFSRRVTAKQAVGSAA